MSKFTDAHVMVTGGLGFVGSTLVRRLVEFGAEVTVVDSLVPQYGGNLFNLDGVADKIKVNISDVRDRHSMAHLVKGQDYIFNLAGQTSHMDSMKDPFTDLAINAQSQLSILEICREHNPGVKIVFASTRQLYGKPDYLPVDEKHPVRPVDVNGINKVAGEAYHILYNNVYGLRCCCLRLTNTYGPRMRVKDARQTFVGIWISKLLTGEAFEVWGGDQLRDFTYVDDAVEAFLFAASEEISGGKIYNLGGDCVISLKDLAELMVEANGGGKFVVKEFPEDRKRIDIGDYYADDSLIQSELSWKPKVDLLEGMKRTLDFYRQQISHYM